jgi:hypothetical protein
VASQRPALRTGEVVAFGAAAARRRLFRPLIRCQIDRVRRGTSPLDDLSQAAHDLDRRAFSRSADVEPGPSSPMTRRWRETDSNPLGPPSGEVGREEIRRAAAGRDVGDDASTSPHHGHALARARRLARVCERPPPPAPTGRPPFTRGN